MVRMLAHLVYGLCQGGYDIQLKLRSKKLRFDIDLPLGSHHVSGF